MSLQANAAAIEICGYLFIILLLYKVSTLVIDFITNLLLTPSPKKIVIDLTNEESSEKLTGYPKFDPSKLIGEQNTVYLWDPSTMDYFGSLKAMSTEEVKNVVQRARTAQSSWKQSSFATRQLLMRTMLRYITENQEACARVAVRDSGKTLLDALIGEVLVTCEKLVWLTSSGEKYLRDEYRDTGRMMMLKKVHVEYVPLGVIGAIVPWNYPFHNVFNPVSAALFAGNAIVIKVSEYASWSIRYYKAIIDACLEVKHDSNRLIHSCIMHRVTHSYIVSRGTEGFSAVCSRLWCYWICSCDIWSG